MENDLISRSALLPELQSYKEGLSFVFESLEPGVEKRVLGAEICGVLEAIIQVNNAPAVDAVNVVRCKECKYFIKKVDVGGFCKCGEVNGGIPHIRVNDDFCSYGERRADDGK